MKIDCETKISITGAILTLSKAQDRIEIDLKECNRNWIEDARKKTDEKTESKGVGERDICANPPFFQFWDDKRTKVVIENKAGILNVITKSKEKSNKKLFLQLQSNINESGYTTLDLS